MAHDEANIPVEAAASLFGAGDDTAADFFATNFDSAPPVDNQNYPEQHPSFHDSSVAASLFEAGPDENASSLFAPTSHDPLQADVGIDTPAGAGYQGPANVDFDSSNNQNQGWQDENGQWHDYNYQNGYTSTHDYAPQQQQPSTSTYAPQAESFSPQYDYTPQPSTDYAPPAPQPAPPAASQTDYSQRYAPSQQQYNSTPHQSPYTSAYSVPSSTIHQNAYNSYSPSVPSSTPNATLYAGQIIPPRNVSKPTDVNAYRPTTLNAYDPPIPRKSRVKTRSTLPSPSTAYSHVVHPRHANTPPPPPPPSQAQQAGVDTLPHLTGQEYSHEVSHGASTEWSKTHEAVSLANAGLLNGNEDLRDMHRSSEAVLSSEDGLSNGTAYTKIQPDLYGDEHEPSHYSELHTSYAPEDTSSSSNAAVVGVDDPSLHTSMQAQETASYGLDDQPFDDMNSLTRVTTPPRQTASPASISAYAPPGNSTVSSGNSPRAQGIYDPYNPTNHSRDNSDVSNAGSTSSLPAATSTTWNPYVPTVSSRQNSTASAPHDVYGAHSSQSVAPNASETSHDPYAPSSRLHRVQSHHSDLSYSGEYTSRYGYPNTSEYGQPREQDVTSNVDATVPENVLTAPTYAPYAPSPSLLGTNDPLGRAAARVPVISFGFGGKLVSCFHSAGETSSGFDVALTARQSTDIQLRTLHEVIPPSAMDSSASSYPGPLFFDPETSSISLARTVGVGTANNAKTKKALVSKWLEETISEISSGVAHITSGSQERYNAEGRLVLVRLLKAMLDNDGQLSGSPAIEWAVRSALIPRLESERPLEGVSSTDMSTYASGLTDINETPLAVYYLKPSALDRIQEFLLRGERRQAYHYALDQRLWAHAMLIASSIDNQAWKEVVNEFLHSELAVKQPLGPVPGSKLDSVGTSTNGRESLRVAYSLFAGQGAAAVQELIPPRALPTSKESLMIPKTGLHATPVSPNFPQPALTSSVPPEALSKWHETAAVMAFSQTTGDSAALTALGDYLSANRWFEAAHACYLLSPRTSSLGGAGVPSVRVVLVGSESPLSLRNFAKDLDVTIFSEIVEFALSLSPAKGQDTFTGLPHLQAYKLIRAAHLAEMGHVEAANRYCEAIGSVIRASTRGSLFYTPTFLGELKNLSDRLTAAPQLDKTASWISSKLAKPSLDTIGSWLEGRFSKLIVGEGEDGQAPEVSEQPQPPKSSYGPFSHYSTISSTTTSASPSPSPTPHGTETFSATPGMPFGMYGSSNVQIDRASSAMDHLRPQARRASPVQRVASASAATTTFAQASNPAARFRQDHGVVSDVAESEGAGDTDGQEVTWWGSSSQDRSGPTPTAATFYKVDEDTADGNFVSLMDSYSPTPATTVSQSQSQNRDAIDDDEEDLGFGNSSRRTPKQDDQGSSEIKNKDKSNVSKATQPMPELKQQSSSWFGRWWSKSSEPTSGPIKAKLGEQTSFVYDKELKRWVNKKAGGTEAASPTPPPPPPPPSRPASQASTPAASGPIKAKLGEESSFYYDKDLKRWVNKKAGGSEATTPSSTPPPPPPSRPRTASPAPSGSPPVKGANGLPSDSPPPRPASAAEMAMPHRKPPRVRSNLVPTEENPTPGSAPPSATSFDTAKTASATLAPPSGIGRPKSSASKRNVRSRYVDVFQQQTES